MMKKEPISVRNVLIARFHRKGGSGSFTKPFEDLQDEAREFMLSAAHLRHEELPIIASYLGRDQWLLVTTERVVWTLDGSLHSLHKEDIREVTIDLALESQSGVRKKSDFTHLVMIDNLGNRHLAKIESGNSFLAVLNVIQAL
jgi:hypothetical protein